MISHQVLPRSNYLICAIINILLYINVVIILTKYISVQLIYCMDKLLQEMFC